MTDPRLISYLKDKGFDPLKEYSIPNIVCLCGSTKFPEAFSKVNEEETIKGSIVLSVGFFLHSSDKGISNEDKQKLDALHFRKIDLANEVYILNVNGYIGDSTANEIAYSYFKKKPIRFLEEKKNFSNPDCYAARLLRGEL